MSTPVSPSQKAKILFFGIHVLIAAGAIALLLWAFPAWFGWGPTQPLRAGVLIAMMLVYLIRHAITLFVMLNRPVPAAEVVPVLVWIAIIDVTMAAAGSINTAPVGWMLWLGVVLYLVGSYLNTGSEWDRKRFKADPAHKGMLYTGGLFRYTQHPNYLGDTILFAGFALATGLWWALIIPVVMAAMFIWIHIPRLDAHLAEHYGEQYERYDATTKKFIPLVW